jgi:hypothetical protein
LQDVVYNPVDYHLKAPPVRYIAIGNTTICGDDLIKAVDAMLRLGWAGLVKDQ